MLTERSSTVCPPAVGNDCAPAACRWGCLSEVVDRLLTTSRARVTGEEIDRLLDLRWLVRQRADAEATLRLFCELRLRMEQRFYLEFFRMRRWLEHHLEAAVRICPAAEPRMVEVRLTHYCVEAVRRVALCAALGREGVLLAPRLEFRFRPAQGHITPRLAAATASAVAA